MLTARCVKQVTCLLIAGWVWGGVYDVPAQVIVYEHPNMGIFRNHWWGTIIEFYTSLAYVKSSSGSSTADLEIASILL